MKLMKRGAAFALAVLMLISAGCGGDTSWVFRSGGDVIPAGLYIIGQINGYSEAMSQIAEENRDDPEFVLSGPRELLKLTVEGKPAGEWINESARKLSREIIAVDRKFASLGLSLDENDNAYIENSVSAVKVQNGDFYSKAGVSDDSLRQYYAFTLKRTRLFTALYSEGGEFAVPDSELRDYFKANYGYAELLPVEIPYSVPEGETRSLEELREQAGIDADNILKRAEAGEAMETIAYERIKENAGAEESLPPPAKDDISMLVSEKDKGEYGEAFVDALLNVKPGETGRFEALGFYFVFKGRDVLEDPALLETYGQTLLVEMKADDFSARLEEWSNEIALEENVAALNRYKPDRIKFPEV